MGVRVVLKVLELRGLGDGFLEVMEDVPFHVRVGVLIDGDSGGGVGTIDRQKTRWDTAFGDPFLERGSDVLYLFPLCGLDLDRFHKLSIEPVTGYFLGSLSSEPWPLKFHSRRRT